jgi:hypothetical protein
MEWQQWARQWARLVRQEGELAEAADVPITAVAGAAAAVREPGRRQQGAGAGADAALQLRTQLDKQLSSLEALKAAPAGHQQARRRQHCEAALAALHATSAAQLQELRQLEVGLAAEHQAAAQRVQEFLQAAAASVPPPQISAVVAGSAAASGGAPAPAVSTRQSHAQQDLPPEVAAHDAFLQRHGPTGSAAE